MTSDSRYNYNLAAKLLHTILCSYYSNCNVLHEADIMLALLDTIQLSGPIRKNIL